VLAGRGFATAALLILVALACIAVAKRLESERRMIRKLRQLRSGSSVSLEGLSEVERDTVERLRSAGVLRMERNRGYLDPEGLKAFKAKRTRFAVGGAFIALLIAGAIAIALLR
jgi:hypothetical protein